MSSQGRHRQYSMRSFAMAPGNDDPRRYWMHRLAASTRALIRRPHNGWALRSSNSCLGLGQRIALRAASRMRTVSVLVQAAVYLRCSIVRLRCSIVRLRYGRIDCLHLPICRATVASVRPFGVFVRSRTLPRDGLVHASQIDDQIELSKDDPDEAKIQALTWAAQPGSEVRSPCNGIRHWSRVRVMGRGGSGGWRSIISSVLQAGVDTSKAGPNLDCLAVYLASLADSPC